MDPARHKHQRFRWFDFFAEPLFGGNPVRHQASTFVHKCKNCSYCRMLENICLCRFVDLWRPPGHSWRPQFPTAPFPGTGHPFTLSTRQGRRCASSCGSKAPPEYTHMSTSFSKRPHAIKLVIRHDACVTLMWFQCRGSLGVGGVIIYVLCLTATPQPHPTLCQPKCLESNPHCPNFASTKFSTLTHTL